MDPKLTGLAYDQITHLWQRDNFDRNNGIAQHKRAITFAKNRGNALDIGCGCTGRFIDLLIEEKFSPVGIDVSAKMIRLAKQRHPNVPFHCQDICYLEAVEQYDFITAWDSIWHIPLNEQRHVMSRIVRSLKPQGILIFSYGGLDKADEHQNTAMGPEVYYSTLGTNGYIALLIELGCIVRHIEYEQSSDMHAHIIAEKL
ncbi:class I SAM-dependent methyltransferase [Thalassotalea fusca]